jgi:DNA-binding beta-propeller fold protein YncE
VLAGASVVAGAAAVVSVFASGCRDGLRPIAVVDTVPPVVQVVSPVDTAYDTNGDKLLDLELTWRDSIGAVDPAAVRVRSLMGVNGTADTGTNLLTVWQVARLDSAGLLLRETLAELLHGGANALEVTLADTAGNRRVDTVAFTLPHGAFLATIPTGVFYGGIPGGGLAICPDDGLLYMAARFNVVVVDPESLTVEAVVRDQYAGSELQEVLCLPGDATLYATSFVERFDRSSRSWLSPVTGSFGSRGIVQSRADPSILYVGEETSGTIGVIDRTQNARVGQLLPFAAQWEYVYDLAVLPGDSKLYATRYTEGGILVIDPGRDSVRGRIAIGDGGPGRTLDVELNRAGTRLFAAILDGFTRGVAEIATSSDSVLRILPLYDYLCVALALSPSERRMFVTTHDNGTPSENVLVDVTNWQVLQTFPRPRTTQYTRFDIAALFRADGKLIFVSRDTDVDVYLSRE